MNNENSYKILDGIRNNVKYRCSGEIIFKTAIQYVLDYGRETLLDEDMIFEWITNIDMKHDKAEKEGKILFCARDFEKALIECAVEIAQVSAVDIIKYIQRNWMFYEWNDINYDDSIDLLKRTIDGIICEKEMSEDDIDEGKRATYFFLVNDCGYEVDELEALGYYEFFKEYIESEDF